MSRAARPGQHSPEDSEDFLERWSHRKTRARAGTAPPDEPPATPGSPAGTDAAPAQAGRAERELTDADMPPVDTLTADSDFSPFMSPGVSDELRQQALRMLFRQPAYTIRDGLDDYDGDYTRFEGLGSLVTREMKRMLRHALKDEHRRRQQAAAGARGSDGAEPDVPTDPAPAPPATSGRPGGDADEACETD